jgi:precorrin-4/cobalt-precorrin-4 C11-methyltransferase
VLFLSVNLLSKVARELTPAYGADCPAVVVHRATWPDQQIVRGTLADIREKVREAGINSQAIIIVGRVLGATDFADSRLYAVDFSHGYRRAKPSAATAGRRTDAE